MAAWKIDNKYSRRYDILMQKARDRGRLKTPHEEHHIWPKSLGGDPKGETVDLTIGEHFIVHWLLMYCTDGLGRRDMAFVVAKFRNSRGKTRILTARQYAISKQVASQWFKDRWKEPEYRAYMSAMTRETQKRAMQDPVYRASKAGPDSPLQRPESHAKQGLQMTGAQNPMRRPELSGDNHANKRDEVRAKISASHVARADDHWTKTDAGRATRSRKQSSLWDDPEYRAQQSAARKIGQAKRREREAAAGGVRRPDMVGDGNPRRNPAVDKTPSPEARAAMVAGQQRRRAREAEI